MRSSDAANLPCWRGQPGFFEIWFFCVFEPGRRRAYWIRYDTFAPATGPARATLWAAAFDAAARDPALGMKAIFPATAYTAGGANGFAVRIGDAELTNGACRGRVAARGRSIAWDLRFTPAAREARRGPRLLEHLPAPTRVAHANSEVGCHGRLVIDGVARELSDGRLVQKHIWGKRRVEELFWLYCPRFDEEPGAALEATSVRLRRKLAGGMTGPALTPLWLRTADGDRRALLRNRLRHPEPGRIELRGGSATRAVAVSASCDLRTLVGWDYRDPAGWDVHVAQSDLASCTVDLRSRPHPLARWGPPRRLTCRDGAALEFHGPEPLAGVRYLGWDET